MQVCEGWSNGEEDALYMSLGKALKDKLVKVSVPQRRNYGKEVADVKRHVGVHLEIRVLLNG